MTSEQQEQLKQIRERLSDNYESASSRNVITVAALAVTDLRFLLSLIDSQAVEVFDGPCVHCGHNNYDSERRECKQRWMEGRMSVVCGCPCAKHSSLANAATLMRNACVAAVRGLRHKSEPDDSRWNAALYHAETKLESLTLDNQEQEKQS